MSDVLGLMNSYRVVNDIMIDWIDKRMVINIVNNHHEVMNNDKSWVVGERIIGEKIKRIEFCIKTQATVRFYELKSSVWDKCLRDEVFISLKNNKMKHLKRLGILQRACVQFASKSWHQK